MADEFPIGHQIGGHSDVWHDIGGWERVHWWCVFGRDAGKWSCTYVADEQPVDELTGHGDTPREAFESLVRMWIFLNDGQESPAMKDLLPGMRATFFKEDGSVVRPEELGARPAA